MTSRYTNRAVAGGAPIRLVPTWASLASIEDGVCLVEDSGWVVARDHRLIANQWVPYEAVAPGTSWVLATNIHKSTFNPASLPAGWTQTGGTLTVPSYIQLAATVDSPKLKYTIGASGTVTTKMLVVSSAAYGATSDVSNGWVGFGTVNLNGRTRTYYQYIYDDTGEWRRGYLQLPTTNEQNPDAISSARVHIQYWRKPAAAAVEEEYGSFTCLPDQAPHLVDMSTGNSTILEYWFSSAADDSWKIDISRSSAAMYSRFDDIIIYYK